MELQLRPATVADHPFLQRLIREAYEELVTRQHGAWDDAFQRARFGKKLQSVQFRIVLLGNQPVGAVSSTDHDDHIFLNELLMERAGKLGVAPPEAFADPRVSQVNTSPLSGRHARSR
jgi:hypothetical protein